MHAMPGRGQAQPGHAQAWHACTCLHAVCTVVNALAADREALLWRKVSLACRARAAGQAQDGVREGGGAAGGALGRRPRACRAGAREGARAACMPRLALPDSIGQLQCFAVCVVQQMDWML